MNSYYYAFDSIHFLYYFYFVSYHSMSYHAMFAFILSLDIESKKNSDSLVYIGCLTRVTRRKSVTVLSPMHLSIHPIVSSRVTFFFTLSHISNPFHQFLWCSLSLVLVWILKILGPIDHIFKKYLYFVFMNKIIIEIFWYKKYFIFLFFYKNIMYLSIMQKFNLIFKKVFVFWLNRKSQNNQLFLLS